MAHTHQSTELHKILCFVHRDKDLKPIIHNNRYCYMWYDNKRKKIIMFLYGKKI